MDGDDTYDASSAPALVRQLRDEGLDMINGARREQSDHAYRPGHRFGNRLLTGLVAWFFGKRFNDMLSGYRVMSRRFVKSFPALAGGFEIETELTVHALQLNLPIAEVMTPYRERPAKSSSKLRTIPDGAARTTGGPSRVRIPADENLSLIAAVRMNRVLLPANPPRRSDRRWTTRIPDRLS